MKVGGKRWTYGAQATFKGGHKGRERFFKYVNLFPSFCIDRFFIFPNFNVFLSTNVLHPYLPFTLHKCFLAYFERYSEFSGI